MTSSHLSSIGSRAVLYQPDCPFDLVHQERVWALADLAAEWPGVREAIPGMTNLTLLLNYVPETLILLHQRLDQLWQEGVSRPASGRLLEIDVIYGGEGGPHLEDVSRMTQLAIDEIIRRHSEVTYTVYAIGSHAGYCYLGGLDPRLETPRRDVPLTRLPAGSLSVAGRQTGMSASAGPSGWNTIAHGDVSFFDPDRYPPALLIPGDRIRFRPVEVIA